MVYLIDYSQWSLCLGEVIYWPVILDRNCDSVVSTPHTIVFRNSFSLDLLKW